MQGVSGSNPLGSTQYFPFSDWVFLMFGFSASNARSVVWCDFWCENCFATEWASQVSFGSESSEEILENKTKILLNYLLTFP